MRDTAHIDSQPRKRREKTPRIDRPCLQCGEMIRKPQRFQKFCSWACAGYAHRVGRVIDDRGYVIIYVGPEHHLADAKGRAYEHRLVAEKMLGRKLREGEIVHHIDHNKSNNSPSNLSVLPSQFHHHVAHRKPDTKYSRMPGEANVSVQCACGCGAAFEKFDGEGRIRRYLPGHNGKHL